METSSSQQRTRASSLKIGRRIRVAFVLLVGVLIVMSVAMWMMYRAQETDAHAIDIAGRNRMLSQRIGFYAEQVVRGNIPERQETLHALIMQHDTSLAVLQFGGVAPGLDNAMALPGAADSLAPVLAHAARLWEEYKVHAIRIASEPISLGGEPNPQILEALFHVEALNQGVLEANDSLTKALVDQAQSRQSVIVSVFFLGVILVLVCALIALFLIWQLLRSIAELPYMARALAQANFLARSRIRSSSEIGQLAESFNTMADTMLMAHSKMEDQIEKRTRALDEQLTESDKTQKAVLNILEDVEDQKRDLEKAQRAALNLMSDIQIEKENVGKEKDKIDAILHSIGDGVFVVDREGVVFMYNRAASRITGFREDTVLGKPFTDHLQFTHTKEQDAAGQFIHKAISTGQITEPSMHSSIVRHDGTPVAIAATAAPLKDTDGHVIGSVVVFRDISKEAAIDKTKTEFVSLASHQLRTPLSTINWYTEMLLAGDAGRITKNQRMYLNQIYTGNQRMGDLVNSLLNVSRLELGTFSIEPVKMDIVKEATSTLHELQPLIKEKKMHIKTTFGSIDHILADPNLVRVIFHNLLTNAIKYTPEEGQVDMSIQYVDDQIEIVVTDTGYGIPQAQQDKIFTKLFRADNVKEKDTTGTGLGLYIIKSIVDHVGGDIDFTSVEGKGTTFRVHLPKRGMIKKKGTRKIG